MLLSIKHNVSFQVDGDILKVLASATVMAEDLYETYTLDGRRFKF